MYAVLAVEADLMTIDAIRRYRAGAAGGPGAAGSTYEFFQDGCLVDPDVVVISYVPDAGRLDQVVR